MRMIFQRWEAVRDNFISWRSNKRGKWIGFVRFEGLKDQRDLELKLDQINDTQRYQTGIQNRVVKTKWRWVERDVSYAEVLRGIYEIEAIIRSGLECNFKQRQMNKSGWRREEHATDLWRKFHISLYNICPFTPWTGNFVPRNKLVRIKCREIPLPYKTDSWVWGLLPFRYNVSSLCTCLGG